MSNIFQCFRFGGQLCGPIQFGKEGMQSAKPAADGVDPGPDVGPMEQPGLWTTSLLSAYRLQSGYLVYYCGQDMQQWGFHYMAILDE